MAAFTNQASLTYNGVTTVSNVVTGTIVGALTVTKTALSGDYAIGDSITYIISLINSGENDFEDVTVTDDLGSYEFEDGSVTPLTYTEGSALLFVDGVPQDEIEVEVTGDGGLNFTGVTVPEDGNALIIYEATVNRFAPLAEGSSITNTATAAANGIGEPVSASETVFVSDEPRLSISKALSPSTVTENGTITYTFIIENSGNTPAGEESELIFSDEFSPVLTDLTAALDGEELTTPADYTYDEATGVFRTLSGVITVPAAKFVTNPDGSVGVEPGRVTLVIEGTI